MHVLLLLQPDPSPDPAPEYALLTISDARLHRLQAAHAAFGLSRRFDDALFSQGWHAEGVQVFTDPEGVVITSAIREALAHHGGLIALADNLTLPETLPQVPVTQAHFLLTSAGVQFCYRRGAGGCWLTSPTFAMQVLSAPPRGGVESAGSG